MFGNGKILHKFLCETIIFMLKIIMCQIFVNLCKWIYNLCKLRLYENFLHLKSGDMSIVDQYAQESRQESTDILFWTLSFIVSFIFFFIFNLAFAFLTTFKVSQGTSLSCPCMFCLRPSSPYAQKLLLPNGVYSH